MCESAYIYRGATPESKGGRVVGSGFESQMEFQKKLFKNLLHQRSFSPLDAVKFDTVLEGITTNWEGASYGISAVGGFLSRFVSPTKVIEQTNQEGKCEEVKDIHFNGSICPDRESIRAAYTIDMNADYR
jgi:hypothetical protein